MGMYTRLTLWAEIPEDSPAVPVLKFLADPQGDPPAHDDHRFFDAERWRWVLSMSSYYHQTQGSRFVHDDIAKTWFLNVDSSIKNYGNEIDLFLDWLAPYLAKGQSCAFIGFTQYEEAEEPTLLYYRRGNIEQNEPVTVPW